MKKAALATLILVVLLASAIICCEEVDSDTTTSTTYKATIGPLSNGSFTVTDTITTTVTEDGKSTSTDANTIYLVTVGQPDSDGYKEFFVEKDSGSNHSSNLKYLISGSTLTISSVDSSNSSVDSDLPILGRGDGTGRPIKETIVSLMDLICTAEGKTESELGVTKVVVEKFTALPGPTFYNSTIIEEYEAPTVMKYNGFCFMDCTNLTTVILAQGITSTAHRMFSNCTQLKSVRSCGESSCAFSVHLPSLKSSANNDFANCKSIETVCLPELTSIGYGTYGGCGLHELYAPKITYISDYCFSGCKNLKALNDDDVHGKSLDIIDVQGVINLQGMRISGAYSFTNSGVEHVINLDPATGTSRDSNNKVQLLNGTFGGCTKLVRFNDDVDGVINLSGFQIVTLKFENNKVMQVVDLKDVESLPDWCFNNCSNLLKVINNGMATISEGCYSGCTSLSSFSSGSDTTAGVVDLNGVATVNASAFKGCATIKKVINGSLLTSISESLFNGCSSLTTVSTDYDGRYVEDTVELFGITSIGGWAFQDTPIKKVIAYDLRTILAAAFMNCKQLTTINSDEGEAVLPNGLTTIQTIAFQGTNITEFHLPSTVSRIGDKALYSSAVQTVFFHSLDNITKSGTSTLAERNVSVHGDLSDSDYRTKCSGWFTSGSTYASESTSNLTLSKRSPSSNIFLGPSGAGWDAQVIDKGKVALPYFKGSSAYVETGFGVGSASPTDYKNGSKEYAGQILAVTKDSGAQARSGDAITIHAPRSDQGGAAGHIYLYNGITANEYNGGSGGYASETYYQILPSYTLTITYTGNQNVDKTQDLVWQYGKSFVLNTFSGSDVTGQYYTSTPGSYRIYLATGSDGSGKLSTEVTAEDLLVNQIITVGYWATGFIPSSNVVTYNIYWVYNGVTSGTVRHVESGKALGDAPVPANVDFTASPDGYDPKVYNWYTDPSGDVQTVYDKDRLVYSNLTYYLVYTSPLPYKLTVVYNGSDLFTLEPQGPYSFDVATNTGQITYTDAEGTTVGRAPDSFERVTGFTFSYYTNYGDNVDTSAFTYDSSSITHVVGGSGSSRSGLTYDVQLLMHVDERSYEIRYWQQYDTTSDDKTTTHTDEITEKFSGYNSEIEKFILTYTQLASGFAITPPAAPSPEGSNVSYSLSYVFAKFADGTLRDPITVSNGVVTLYAGYFGNNASADVTFVYDIGWTISIDYNNSDVSGEDQVDSYPTVIKDTESNEVTFDINDVTRTGYHLKGWYIVNQSTGEYEVYDTEGASLKMSYHRLIELGGSGTNQIKVGAIWESNSYTISFYGEEDLSDSKGTQSGFRTDSIDDTYGRGDVVTKISIPAPTKTGYTFDHWKIWIHSSTTGSDTEINVESGEELKLTPEFLTGLTAKSEIVGTAVWRANIYTVQFDLNGPTSDSQAFADKTLALYEKAGDATLELPSMGLVTYSHHSFLGWRISGDNEKDYRSPGETFAITVSNGIAAEAEKDGSNVVKIIALWDNVEYHFQFNSNGATSGDTPDSISGIFGAHLDWPKAEIFARDGYAPSGWALGSDDTYKLLNLDTVNGELIQGARTVEGVSNVITLYVKWEPQRYTIVYDTDGGALGLTSPAIVYSGVEFNISIPSKTGFSFDGWTPSGLGDGAKYRLGDSLVTWKDGDTISAASYIDLTYATNGSVTLKAHWTAIRYTVSYDLNGGEGTIPASQYPITVGSTFAADSGSGLSRTGYTFGGWSIDGVTPIMTTSGQMSLTNAMAATADDANVITLQAVWSPNIYRIHVIESPDSDYYLTASYGESVDLGTPSRVFYTFNGWSLNPASGETRSSDAKYSTSGGLWVSWPSGTGAVNARYAMDLATSETITVEASWTAVTYYINYDLNNGRGSTSSASATIHASDTSITFPSAVSRSGYTLKGWSINGTTVLENTDIRTMVSNADATGTVTLIAVWTPTKYTINVIEVEGSISYQVPAVYGESVYLGIPTRAYYTFAGWSIPSGQPRSDDARYSTTGTGQWIQWAAGNNANAGYVMDISLEDEIEVRAVWTPVTYYLEYDLDGGSGSASSASSTIRITDSSVTLPTRIQVTRGGYDLRGWSINGSTVLAATDVRTMVANADDSGIITLKALWNSNSYRIHVTGTGSADYDVPAVYGESIYLGIPTRTYYTFAGWSIPTGQTRSEDARYSVSGGSLWIPWPDGNSAVNAGYVMDLATTGTINIQATWTAVTYYIDYDLNGGTGSTSRASTTVRITDSSVNFPTSSAISRGGYTLGGWSVNGITVIQSTDVQTIVRGVDSNGTVTLHAVWSSNLYLVHVVEVEDSVEYDVSAVYDESVSLGIPTRAYYTFAGWSIPANQSRSSDARYSVSGDGWIPWPSGTTAVNAGYAIDLAYSGTITVQATWNANTYHIEYDLNGGKGSTDSASTTVKVTDASVTLPSSTVTRDGYTLRGWSVNGATVLEDTDVRTIVGAADDTDIVKLIAVWGSNTYTVHVVEVKDSIEYDVSAVYGEAVSLGIPTRSYYTFAGWNIVPAAREVQSGDARYSTSGSGQWIPWPTDGTYVNAGYVMDLALSSTIHVEAVWNAKSIYIEYDYNGGRGSTDGASATVRITDEKVTLPNATQVTRQGYALNGWSLNGTVVLADTDVSSIVRGADENDTVTLHAVWSTLDYTIKYRTLDTDDYVTVSATFDAALNLGTPTRQWYVFEGWLSTDVSTDTARYSQDGTNWMPWPTVEDTPVNGGYMMNLTSKSGGVVTLDAVWTPRDIYIEYNLNGGTGTTDKASLSVKITDQRMVLPAAGDVSREGYALMGWSLNGVTTIAEGDVQTVVRASGSDGTVTLIAMWSTVDYSVRYRALDTDEYITVSATFDVPLNIGMPTRPGYTFAGWTSTDVSSEAARYSSDGSFWIPWPSQGIAARGGYVINLTGVADSTVTLNATWNLLMVNVDYDLNGGTGEVTGGSAQVHLGMTDFSFAQPGTAHRAGYTFSGWSLDKETVLTGFTDRMVLEADSNNRITLYAVWTANAYYIEYRSTEDATYVRTQVYYDVSVEIGTPDRVGYSFLGWSSTDVDKEQSRFSTNDVIWQEWPSEGNAYGGYVKNLSTVSSGVVHLTAVWDKTVYTVTYDANGSSAVPPVDSATYTLDDPFTLASINSLQGTNGKRIATGWALDQTATTGITVSSFVASLAQAADSFNNVTLYAVWIEGKYAVMVDIGDAKPSIVPTGWTLNSDGLYQREADYGSLTKDVLSDWDDTSFDWEGHKFTAWRYDISSVITDVTVTADFEEVHQWYLYAFVGVIIVIAIIAFAVTRLERW